MRKIIEDLERKEIARRRNISIPIEYRSIDDLDTINMPPRVSCPLQLRGLQCRERRGNLNDFEFCPLIHIWVDIANEIQDVQHQCSVPGTHFVYNQIMKGVMQ